MDFLAELWLPILLSAAAVWIASALAWMALPHHKGEMKPLPNEDAFIAAARQQNPAPGMYVFPECDHSKMKDPEFKAKLQAGPAGMLHIWPPGAFTNMGGKMIGSFIFYLVVSVFVAYVAWEALRFGPAIGFTEVFQIAGTVAIMAYCFGRIPHDIWFMTPRRAMVTNFIDGLVYGLITATIFGWLWPGA